MVHQVAAETNRDGGWRRILAGLTVFIRWRTRNCWPSDWGARAPRSGWPVLDPDLDLAAVRAASVRLTCRAGCRNPGSLVTRQLVEHLPVRGVGWAIVLLTAPGPRLGSSTGGVTAAALLLIASSYPSSGKSVTPGLVSRHQVVLAS